MLPDTITLPPVRQFRSPFKALDVAKATRDDYKARLPHFFAFVNDEGGKLDIDSFLRYKQCLEADERLGVSAKNKYLVSAKAYLREMHRQGLLPIDITANVKTFGQSKKHKRVGITEAEAGRLCEHLTYEIDPSDPRNIRLKAIIGLLLYQGLRTVEICRLNWRDFDMDNEILFVQGKGRHDKEPVNLHPQASQVLMRYFAEYYPKFIPTTDTGKSPNAPLFVSDSNSSRGHRLTPRGLRSIVKPVLEELGINKTVHGFRHCYTTMLIKEFDGNLLEVARYTRHRSLEMLQVYNDAVIEQADLPRYYRTFEGLELIPA